MQRFLPLLRVTLIGATSVLVVIMGRDPRAQGTAQPASGQPQSARPVVRPHTFDLESSYIRVPLLPADQQYARIDGARMKRIVDDLTGISRQDRDQGNRYWGRLPGTKSDAMAEQLIATKFREMGLADVRMQPFDLPPQWFATDWDFSASGSGSTLTFKTIFPAEGSVATPPTGLDLEVVWVGLGSELDFAGRDVKGKMVFIQSEPRPNGARASAGLGTGVMKRAADLGAAALLVNVALPGNLTSSYAAEPGLPPSFAIGSDDASALKTLMAKGSVRAHVRLVTEQRSGLKDANVWGTLPGTTDEEIVVIAHHDGYFEAALDNASGTATMMGLAEYFASIPQAMRRRTLKFVSTGSHSFRSAGTTFMHNNRASTHPNAVLVMNCEHTSVTQMNQFGPILRKTTNINARQWWINGSDKLASIVFDAYKTFGVTIWDGEMYEGGDMGPLSRDQPSVQLIVTPQYYNSDFDRADIVPASGLEAVARAYAKIIDQANRLSRNELVGVPSAGGESVR